ncbi:MAG: riboflavin synthase [Deltaproteobacteria bacterium]
MFTGIVEDIGRVREIKAGAKDAALSFELKNIPAGELVLGESIAVNGACLTVTSIGSNTFTVDASQETLRRTNLGNLKPGSRVNLERAMKVGGRLGGHIVNGHVDGVGRVDSLARRGESLVVWFSIPEGLSKYVVEKGSIAVSGVSLTVNEVEASRFSVNLIPFTQEATALSDIKAGDAVNIECDIIAKYVEKLTAANPSKKKTIAQMLENF